MRLSYQRLLAVTGDSHLAPFRGEVYVTAGEVSQESPPDESIVRIRVDGGLTHTSSWWDESVTYRSLRSNIPRYLEKNTIALVVDISSGGGDVLGLEAACEFLHSVSSTYDIPTYAFTDSLCCSAAFALANACDYFYATPKAMVGSVGVICALTSYKKGMEADGIQQIVIRDPDEKALGQPSEDLDEKLIQKTKLRIGEAADSLFSLITRHTPTTTEKTLRKLRGNTLTGEEASSLGIISGTVPTLDSLYTIININSHKKESSMKPTPTPIAGVAVPAVAALPKIPSATAVPVVPTAAATLDSTAPTDEIQAAVNTERLRSSKILQAGTTFGIRAEAIQQMIASGATAEAATTSFQFIASEVSALAGIPMGAAISTQPVAEQADTTDRTASPDALFGVEA